MDLRNCGIQSGCPGVWGHAEREGDRGETQFQNNFIDILLIIL